MAQATLTQQISVGGISINASVARSEAGVISQDLSGDFALAAGNAGTLSTRTDNNTGVLTLGDGHSITTGMTVDVFWDGGVRYGMTVGTVNVNDVPIDLGAGDNLPAEDAEIVVSEQRTIDIDVDGDLLSFLAAAFNRRVHIDFLDDGAVSLLAVDLPASEPFEWHSDSPHANLLAGSVVAEAKISNGESAGTASGGFGLLYDSLS